jgi:hypothetical protein
MFLPKVEHRIFLIKNSQSYYRKIRISILDMAKC